LVPLTKWVSNMVFVTKKYGTIHDCIDFLDLIKVYPKDNYSTPSIVQIINECVGNEMFSFMDRFSSYNGIQIHLEDQHKIGFIFSLVHVYI
jgi:hypothetical protein